MRNADLSSLLFPPFADTEDIEAAEFDAVDVVDGPAATGLALATLLEAVVEDEDEAIGTVPPPPAAAALAAAASLFFFIISANPPPLPLLLPPAPTHVYGHYSDEYRGKL